VAPVSKKKYKELDQDTRVVDGKKQRVWVNLMVYPEAPKEAEDGDVTETPKATGTFKTPWPDNNQIVVRQNGNSLFDDEPVGKLPPEVAEKCSKMNKDEWADY